eukprot:4497345-Pleurochrysis_carterae.AAC.2
MLCPSALLFADAGRWKYRFAMQANLFPGALYRMSYVPPCLYTGTNFRLTAFIASLHRCYQLGKL